MIIILGLALSFAPEAEIGKYTMEGLAYLGDEERLIVNERLDFQLGDRKFEVYTDDLGRYSVEIDWSTWDLDGGPMQKDGRYLSLQQANEKINPPLQIRYKDKLTEAPNYWQEELKMPQNDRGGVRKIDLYFF